jgi:hypothetical protein
MVASSECPLDARDCFGGTVPVVPLDTSVGASLFPGFIGVPSEHEYGHPEMSYRNGLTESITGRLTTAGRPRMLIVQQCSVHR